MVYLQRGALVEYGTDLLGPLKNFVIFQFNPETLSRNIDVPRPPSSSASAEINQEGVHSFETISLAANFSAADELDRNFALARAVGIGPQLAALEEMVNPKGSLSDLVSELVDAVGSLLGNGSNPSQPIPREQYPKILFIWGATRILPVVIESMQITEQQYDYMLNPIQAKVDMRLRVIVVDACSNDNVARGAQAYSNLAKKLQAIANLANNAQNIADMAKNFQSVTNPANTSALSETIPFR